MRPLDVIIAMFLLTQILALGVGVLLITNQSTNPSLAALNVAPEQPQNVLNAFYLIFAILIGAGALLIIMMLPFRNNLILVLEFLSTTVASFIVFFTILSVFNVGSADLISLITAIALFAIRLFYIPFRNVLAMIASAGVGAVIGFSINPIPLIVFVIFVAIYDFLAVKWTGHMVKFAKQFMNQKTSFTVGFEGVREKTVQEKGKRVMKEEPWMIALGSGDMAIASAITVVSFKFGGLLFPLFAMIGSTFGLYFVMMRAAKEKAILPAMPLIVGFSLGFLAILLVFMSLLKLV